MNISNMLFQKQLSLAFKETIFHLQNKKWSQVYQKRPLKGSKSCISFSPMSPSLALHDEALI